MKKILYLTLCIAALASCTNVKREKELAAQNDSLTAALNEKNAALDQAMQAIADIQEGFRAINEAEGRVSIQSQGGEGITDAERMKEDILFIQQKLADNRKQIEELQKKLKSGGTETANLRKVLANLQQELNDKVASITALQNELARKNIRIAELDSAVVMLTGDVNALHEVAESQEKLIKQQTAQLNAAWYVYGTAKELKEQNILNKGEVLTSTEFNKNYFTEIDIREDKVFPLYSKRAKLLTTHPTGSYEFTKDEEKQLTLSILDPVAFWSVSRYMVIQVR
jgi:chromosome segregation ATPase